MYISTCCSLDDKFVYNTWLYYCHLYNLELFSGGFVRVSPDFPKKKKTHPHISLVAFHLAFDYKENFFFSYYEIFILFKFFSLLNPRARFCQKKLNHNGQ